MDKDIKKPRQAAGLNPFLPFDTYVPDGEPKVFGGRVYLYGSYDLFNRGYCCGVYHTFSAPADNLADWTDHGVSFSSELVPWSNADLYAPDVLYHKGEYYLFFCMSDGSEGVARSDRPEGPFTRPERITLDGEPIRGIDPSVLEDGGKIYYTWGQFSLNIAELKDDMHTLDSGSLHTAVITNDDEGEGFHEGSSLRKIGEHYCLIYASEYSPSYPHKGSRPTKLDYALSLSPCGPFERKGTIIDNDGADPDSWNNHGSVIKIGEEWFVFYHASTNNSRYSRRARAERLKVDEEKGLIQKADMTSLGFAREIGINNITSPVNACRFFGGAYLTEEKGIYFPAVIEKSGAGFSFSPVKFEKGRFDIKLALESETEAALKVTAGEYAAGLSVSGGEGAKTQTVSLNIEKAGPYPLTFEFLRPQGNLNLKVYTLEITDSGLRERR